MLDENGPCMDGADGEEGPQGPIGFPGPNGINGAQGDGADSVDGGDSCQVSDDSKMVTISYKDESSFSFPSSTGLETCIIVIEWEIP